jgi:NAD(P)-dependent dehydrogenase (short-subunit alcohol dehydrogenase family)
LALTLAGAGATVLCAGRTVKELEATARAITKKGGKAHVVPLDITDEAAVREQVETVIRRHRRIDVLVNNAGVIHRSNIVDTATEDFRKVIETDLIGQFVLAREVGRHMLARKYGRIVSTCRCSGTNLSTRCWNNARPPSAGASRRICAARCCCSPPMPAPTSPATRWWSMAA